MIKCFKKIKYLIVLMLLLCTNLLYAATSNASDFAIDNGGIKSNGFLDPSSAVREEPGNVVGNMLVTGDSYGGFFVSFLKSHHGYNIDKNSYCRPQKTVIENYEIYQLAFIANCENVVLSIGFNDFIKQTDLNDFYHYVVLLVKRAEMYGKRLILHSFLSVPYLDDKDSSKYKNTFEEYDTELRIIAAKYDNVEYIDITDIQNNPEFLLDDQIHYNEKMYFILYDRIQEMLNKKQKEVKVIMSNN